MTIVAGGDSFDPAVKRRIQPEACRAGGDLVVMTKSSKDGFGGHMRLLILRRVAADPPIRPADGGLANAR